MERKGTLGELYEEPPPPPSDEHTLNVAIYPYVPNLGAFIATVETCWELFEFGATRLVMPADKNTVRFPVTWAPGRPPEQVITRSPVRSVRPSCRIKGDPAIALQGSVVWA